MAADPAADRLILIKHAMPVVQPGVTPARWELSAEGRESSRELARLLAARSICRVITSQEPKAAETAAILARELAVPCDVWPDLHEHDRSDVTLLDTPEAFAARVLELFARPDEVVYGRESARTARARFESALAHVESAHPRGTLAVVAHGTVIALAVAGCARLDGHDLWKRLGLPSFVELTRGSREVVGITERVR